MMSEENATVEAIGKVNISEEVIAIVSGVASMEVKGVHGMCNTLSGGIAELLGKKSLSKGVKVELTENDTRIAVSLIVDFGCKIPDVAWEVQEKVKREVENMTGLTVLAVDVYVNAVHFPKEEPVKEPEITVAEEE